MSKTIKLEPMPKCLSCGAGVHLDRDGVHSTPTYSVVKCSYCGVQMFVNFNGDSPEQVSSYEAAVYGYRRELFSCYL